MNTAPASIGRSLDSALHYRKQLAQAGFVNIKETTLRLPTNTWPADIRMKQLGALTCQNLLDGLEGLSLALFTRQLGWTREEVARFVADVRKDVVNTDYHGYFEL